MHARYKGYELFYDYARALTGNAVHGFVLDPGRGGRVIMITTTRTTVVMIIIISRELLGCTAPLVGGGGRLGARANHTNELPYFCTQNLTAESAVRSLSAQ